MRCWWRSFFGTGWVAWWRCSRPCGSLLLCWHLELLRHTPRTGHGAPGISADERGAGDARIPASFLPDPLPSSTRPPKGQPPIKTACPSPPRTPPDVWGIFESLTGRKESVRGPAPALPCPPKGSGDRLLARLAGGVLRGVSRPRHSPEASGAARERRRGKKGKPTPEVPSREDSPTLAEVGGPRPVPRPARAPHPPILSSDFPAEPALESSAAQARARSK